MKKVKGFWITVLVIGLNVNVNQGVMAETAIVEQPAFMSSYKNLSNFANKSELIKDSLHIDQSIEAGKKITEVWKENSVESVRNEIQRQKEIGLKAYVIQWGDTLGVISQASGVSIKDIVDANHLNSDLNIVTGDLLDGVLNSEDITFNLSQNNNSKVEIPMILVEETPAKETTELKTVEEETPEEVATAEEAPAETTEEVTAEEVTTAEETTAEETTAEETTAEETTAEETTAEETTSEETTVEETTVEETTAEETTSEETTVEETTVEETTAEETTSEETTVEETTVEETTVEETTAEETTVEETTAEETTVEETTAEETTSEETTVEETTSEETTVEETTVEETTAEETTSEETTVEETTVEETTVEETTAEETTVEETTVEETTVEETTVEETTAEETTAEETTAEETTAEETTVEETTAEETTVEETTVEETTVEETTEETTEEAPVELSASEYIARAKEAFNNSVNFLRNLNGMESLTVNSELDKAALIRSEENAELGMSHYNADGSLRVKDAIAQVNYPTQDYPVLENLASGGVNISGGTSLPSYSELFGTPEKFAEDIVNGWYMDLLNAPGDMSNASKGHRKQYLVPFWTETGWGIDFRENQQANGSVNVEYQVTQVFANPNDLKSGLVRPNPDEYTFTTQAEVDEFNRLEAKYIDAVNSRIESVNYYISDYAGAMDTVPTQALPSYEQYVNEQLAKNDQNLIDRGLQDRADEYAEHKALIESGRVDPTSLNNYEAHKEYRESQGIDTTTGN